MVTDRATPTRRETRHRAFRANVAAVFAAGAHGRDTCNLVLAPSGAKQEPCRAILRAKASRATPLHTVAPAQLWSISGGAVFSGGRNRAPVWPPARAAGEPRDRRER